MPKMSGTVFKHVFLDFYEYQRLLEAKEKNEELLVKIRDLERRLEDMEKLKNQDGKGNLSGLIANKEKRESLNPPMPKILPSISMPPSAQIDNSTEKEKRKAYDTQQTKWYFLGPPRNN